MWPHLFVLFSSAYFSAAFALDFRPPAIPLFTTDPFFQTWMRGDNSTAASVTHWAGEIERQMVGLVNIDGNAYSYLGEPGSSAPVKAALAQRSVRALPTRTVFELELAGVVAINVTFLSTMFTDDYLRLSRPTYYLILDVASLDGEQHKVAAYFDISAQHVVNKCQDQQVQWKRWSHGTTAGVQIGSQAQDVLGSKGDRVNIDWGWLHLGAVPASDGATALFAGSAAAARAQFVSAGMLPTAPDTRMPRAACGDDMPALATSHTFGAQLGRHTTMLGYDDVESVFYFGDEFRGLWTQHYPSIMHAMDAAAAEVDAMLARSAAHDHQLITALTAKAGPKYAALCSLAYRQTLGATKLVWNHKKNTTWSFLKEISTNGDMQTMDVIYPGSPMLLYTNPELLKLLLIPVLSYAHNDTYIRFSDPYSPHQLGTYPIANDTTARQEPMPLENSGNMLFMLLAIAQRTADATDGGTQWLAPYFPMLTSWADELVRTTEFPANQICTDDFTGPLANNTNLGAKGIISLEAFAQICHLLVNTGQAGAFTAVDCGRYSTVASEYAKTWMKYAYAASPAPHYKMSYNAVKGVSDSWSIKYNLLWQRLLKLQGPFPWDEVVGKEISYYKSKSNAFGIPMDPRHTYVKTDWLSWAAAMTSTDADFHAIMDPIFKFANETPSRNPFTDLYDTKTGVQSSGGFIARPVIGGIFAKMLL